MQKSGLFTSKSKMAGLYGYNSDYYYMSLRQSLILELKNMFGIVKCLMKEYPLLEREVTSIELKSLLALKSSKTHLQFMRLEEGFKVLAVKHKSRKKNSIRVILQEYKSLRKMTDEHPVIRDKKFVLVCRKIDHYMIASYSEMIKHAHALEITKVSQSLYSSLEEVMNADTALRQVSLP